ncbi:asparagine synthetase B [Candidatus Bathyarchaeota archaeon]|nr:asparagine synthetase B [Candidatus Bathyarchaeota archaeon]
MGEIIAVLSKKDGNVAKAATTMLESLKHRNVETFGMATPSEIAIETTIKAIQDQEMNSHLIVGHVFSRILDGDRPQPVDLGDATLVFEGRVYSQAGQVSDIKTVVKKLQRNYEGAKSLVKEAHGDFVFAMALASRIVAGRDVVGGRPLYYGENEELAALASERKALWRIGIGKTDSFPPGHIALLDKHGFGYERINTLTYSKPRRITMQVAVKELQRVLLHAMKERLSGLKEVTVAFSGGLDSSIIAFLAKQSNVDTNLIHVSLRDQPESGYAKKAAEELGLPIHVCLFKEEDVEKAVPEVVKCVEEPDPIKVSIGIPVYWAAEKTAEMGFKVLLAGQGADELFGGYKRYVDELLLHGNEDARRMMFDDATKIHETNLERDFKICEFNGVELRLPFASFEIVKFAIDLPLNLKIESKQNTARKLVLRHLAENIGLSSSVSSRPKKAIQYATGVASLLRKIAKRKGLTIREYLCRMCQENRQTDCKI